MKNIKKYNKPALRVFDANEHPNPEDPGGTWQAFDAKIEQAEKAELKRQGVQEEYLEKVFLEKRQQELSHRKMGDLSWQEVHLLNDMRKPESRFYTPDVQKIAKAEMPTSAHAPTGGKRSENSVSDTDASDDMDYRACLQMIRTSLEILPEIQPALGDQYPKLVNLFGKLATKIKQEMEQQQKEPEREPEEIRDETPVKITQGIQIHKGNIVSGWSSIEEIDSSGDVLPLEELQKNLQDFYKNDGKVCLNHSENNIIGQLRSYEFKKNAQGKPGLYVNVGLHDNISKDIIQDISNGRLKGFSWSFRANREKTCQRDKCYNNLNVVPNSISELSIVTYPCNKNALIESIHEAS